MLDIDRILTALKSVRLTRAGLAEREICAELSMVLATHQISHRREHPLAPRCRIDIWIPVRGVTVAEDSWGVVVEVKKGRPPRAEVIAQLHRYAAVATVRAVILVLERHIPLPPTIHDKPISGLSLNSLWGLTV